jgi:alpha-galactosidase
MDIDPKRLEESEVVARKLMESMGAPAKVETTTDRRRALAGAHFVVTAFQIGGYRPSTVIDFEIPKAYGLRQTIADTLGVGGIMRGLRTVPHLWAVAQDMAELCPDALLLQYVNPMAINTWALAERFPRLKQVGLCHSVQNTVEELAHDLDLPKDEIDYRVAGVNHVAFFLRLEHKGRDLYPALRQGYREGRFPKPPLHMTRCPNKVRYEVMDHLGHFCTESSEHLAEYTPWFIKDGRPDLIDSFGIPLDEYPKRCEEQMANWGAQADSYRTAPRIEVRKSHEFAAEIMNAAVTGAPYVIYGNLPNRGQAPAAPHGRGGGDALPRRPQRRPALGRGRHPAAARGADAHPDQRAGAHRPRAGGRGRFPPLPRRLHGPPHRGRARPPPDPRPRDGPPRRPRRLDSGLGASPEGGVMREKSPIRKPYAFHTDSRRPK